MLSLKWDDRPLSCRCRGWPFETSRRRDLSKKFYKIFQGLHDYKNFQKHRSARASPAIIGFSPVFPAYPVPPCHPSIFPITIEIWVPLCSLHQIRGVSSRRTLDASRCSSWDRSSSPKSAENLNGAAFWWLLGVVIASITWSTSPNSRSRAQIRGRGDPRSKLRRCARFPRRSCTKRKSPVGGPETPEKVSSPNRQRSHVVAEEIAPSAQSCNSA